MNYGHLLLATHKEKTYTHCELYTDPPSQRGRGVVGEFGEACNMDWELIGGGRNGKSTRRMG